MFPNSYFPRAHFTDTYFPPPAEVDVVIPLPGGGGSGAGVGRGDYFNQAPSTKERKRSYLALARQEDEELIILIKAFAEVIQWH